MGISKDIQQTSFQSEYAKAVVNVIYTSSWLNQQHIALFKPFGLTPPQFNILRILRGQHPNACTVNLLIERMLDKSSNASRIVDKLEEKELVIRRKCEVDKRAVDVLISKRGLKLLKDIDQGMNNWESDVNKLSEKESETLNQLLDKLRS